MRARDRTASRLRLLPRRSDEGGDGRGGPSGHGPRRQRLELVEREVLEPAVRHTLCRQADEQHRSGCTRRTGRVMRDLLQQPVALAQVARRQAVTTFSQTESPPLERGITWSSVAGRTPFRSRRISSHRARRAPVSRYGASQTGARGRTAEGGSRAAAVRALVAERNGARAARRPPPCPSTRGRARAGRSTRSVARSSRSGRVPDALGRAYQRRMLLQSGQRGPLSGTPGRGEAREPYVAQRPIARSIAVCSSGERATEAVPRSTSLT